jgi:hypothetical protein
MGDEEIILELESGTVDDVYICNLALLKIGNADNYIVSLTDDDTKVSRAFSKALDQCRFLVMTLHPWASSTKRDTLTPLEDESINTGQYDYAFQTPADCLRIFQISDDEGLDDNSDLDYKRVGPYILCDATELYVSYSYKNTDPATYDRELIEALALALAIYVCESLTGSGTIKQNLLAEWDSIIRKLEMVDMIQNYNSQRGSSELVSIRG